MDSKNNSKRKLVAFLARRRRGKDECGNYLKKKYNFNCRAFALPVKKSCIEKYGLTNEHFFGDLKETKDPFWNITPREIMQYEGTEIGRMNMNGLFPNIGQDFWIKTMEKYLLENKDIDIAVTDCRFQNEVDFIHKMGGIVVKINRKSMDQSKNQFDNHNSELEIDNIKNFDYIINNDYDLQTMFEFLDHIINIHYK